MDSDCIRFGPGDCSVTLRPRLEYVPKSLSTPFERTETVPLSALATKSSPSLQFAPSGLWDFTLTVHWHRSSFWVLWEGPSLIEAKSVTLDCGRYHRGIYNPRFGKCPLHIRGRSTRRYRSTWAWSRCMCIQDICLAAGWSSQNTFAMVYKLDVQSLASQVRSVSN